MGRHINTYEENNLIEDRLKEKAVKHGMTCTVFIEVRGANPNSPSDSHLPRTDIDGYGIISGECLRRKIRNVVQDLNDLQDNPLVLSGKSMKSMDNMNIFVQSQNHNRSDAYSSEETRYKNTIYDASSSTEEIMEKACNKYFDVRAFGNTFPFAQKDKLQIAVTGPVTVTDARSLSPITIETLEISKCENGSEKEEGGKSSDRLGSRSYVPYAVYMFRVSVSAYRASKTGFSEEDLSVLKYGLLNLFANDESVARPAGSMIVKQVYMWNHENQTPSISSWDIDEGFDIKLKDDVDYPTKFSDYVISWNCPNHVKNPEKATPEIITLH